MNGLVDGKWELLRVLSASPRATVWSARHVHGYVAALKIARGDAARNPATRSQLIRQAAVANAVGHIGAVLVLDDGVTSDGAPYIVTDLVDGESLETLQDRSPSLRMEDALRIARETLGVLAAAHQRGLVHGAVGPSCVLLARDGGVKLTGFGRSRSTAQPHDDVWAVGAMLFHMLTGRAPFAMRGTRRPIGEIIPALGPALASAVERAIDLDPAVRFADASAMLAALDAANEEHVPFPSSGTMPMLTLPLPRRAASHPSLPPVTPAPAPAPAPGAPIMMSTSTSVPTSPRQDVPTMKTPRSRGVAVRAAMAALGFVVAILATGLARTIHAHEPAASAQTDVVAHR
jgi:serine/threonine protein kinase